MGQRSMARALVSATILAAGIALLYFTELAHRRPAGGDRPELWVFVALGIWAAYAQPVPVRNRQFSMSVALSEIPALVGVVFLAPGPALVAMCCGHLAASAQRRLPPIKALINCELYLVGVGVGILTYDTTIGSRSPISAHGWAVTLISITLINVVDLCLLLVVFAIVDPRWRRPPLRSIGIQGGAGVAVCSAGGLVAISLIWVNTWGVVLFIAIAGAANLAYRGTMISGQRYANLEKLYEFTRALGSLVEANEVIATVLDEACSLVSAESASS